MVISDIGHRMLDAVASFDQWVSRGELAKHLGKKRLNPHEVAALDLLVERGQLEAEKRSAPGPIGYQWVYRVRR